MIDHLGAALCGQDNRTALGEEEVHESFLAQNSITTRSHAVRKKKRKREKEKEGAELVSDLTLTDRLLLLPQELNLRAGWLNAYLLAAANLRATLSHSLKHAHFCFSRHTQTRARAFSENRCGCEEGASAALKFGPPIQYPRYCVPASNARHLKIHLTSGGPDHQVKASAR